jgi:hypothetical protein
MVKAVGGVSYLNHLAALLATNKVVSGEHRYAPFQVQYYVVQYVQSLYKCNKMELELEPFIFTNETPINCSNILLFYLSL